MVLLHQPEEVLECIETVGLGAFPKAYAPDLGKGTGSVIELACFGMQPRTVSCVKDAAGSPLRETGRARLGMPDEVGPAGIQVNVYPISSTISQTHICD